MPAINAKLANFKLSTSASTANLTNLTTTLNEIGFPREAEELDVTTFTTGGFRSYINGFQSGTLSLSGFWSTLADKILGTSLGSTHDHPWEYSPQTTSTGKRLFKGNARVLSYEVNSAVSDPITYSASLRVTGAITSTKH